MTDVRSIEVNRIELKAIIHADCDRYINDYCNTRFKVYRRCPGFRYTFWMRMVMYWKSKGTIGKYFFAIIPYLIYKNMSIKYGITVDTNIEIGPGLMIVHQGGVFLNAQNIGSNVTVYQNVTVGSGASNKDIPIIENDVKLLTGSVIYGNIIVGKGSVVAPNAAVNKSVEPYSFVGGVPAKLIKKLK